MISGNEPVKIDKFLFIDRCNEGFGWTRPYENEQFVGIPYSYYADNSKPFIEVRFGHKVVRTINCDDVSQIVFKTGE